MAKKAAATAKKTEAEAGDGPILDLTDADVKKLIKSAKKDLNKVGDGIGDRVTQVVSALKSADPSLSKTAHDDLHKLAISVKAELSKLTDAIAGKAAKKAAKAKKTAAAKTRKAAAPRKTASTTARKPRTAAK